MSENLKVKKTMDLKVKLSFLGLVLLVAFLLVDKYTDVLPESQSVQVLHADVPVAAVLPVPSESNETASDKIYAVSDFYNPIVQINTSLGNLKIELYPEYAPVVVRDLIRLIGENYFNQGVILESRPGIGFVLAKVGEGVQDFVVANNEVNNLRSERGSVAILKQDVSSAYLNNIFVGYKSQLELQDKYIILGHVTEGIDVIEKAPSGKTGSIRSMSVDEKQMSSNW